MTVVHNNNTLKAKKISTSSPLRGLLDISTSIAVSDSDDTLAASPVSFVSLVFCVVGVDEAVKRTSQVKDLRLIRGYYTLL